jgi:large subunit ribosomal protein L40
MRSACEALRLTGEDGLSIIEPGTAILPAGVRDPKERDGMDVEQAARAQKEVGKLYRTAMMKGGVWDGVPIEYARAQTETPSRAGWDHGWTR